MARSSTRRKTHWEGARITIAIDDSGVHGGELVGIAEMDDFAPATLVRIRGVLIASWATSPAFADTNNPGSIFWAIRKVSLARTTDVYAPPGGAIQDEAYTSGEDILAFSGIVLGQSMVNIDAGSVNKVVQRAVGMAEIDVKAMRKFDSAEERLVLEVGIATGQLNVNITVQGALRMLFKAG